VPSNNADPIVHQVTEIADYEALREVANQLAGLLVARQRTATSDEEARAWRLEHRALRARLDDIQPHTPAVTEALEQVGNRLVQLRGGAA
jgi:regulator of replication initiation timing